MTRCRIHQSLPGPGQPGAARKTKPDPGVQPTPKNLFSPDENIHPATHRSSFALALFPPNPPPAIPAPRARKDRRILFAGPSPCRRPPGASAGSDRPPTLQHPKDDPHPLRSAPTAGRAESAQLDWPNTLEATRRAVPEPHDDKGRPAGLRRSKHCAESWAD